MNLLLNENWLTKNIREVFSGATLEFIEMFVNGISKFFSNCVNIAEQPEIKGAINALTLISITMISIVVAKEILNTYVFETEGDSDQDPMRLVEKAAQIVCLVCCNDIIYDTAKDLSELAVKDIGISVLPEEIFYKTEALFMGNLTLLGLVNVIFCLVYVICTLVFVVIGGIRGAELAFMKILWPFFSLDLMTVTAESWKAFLSSYGITFFGYILRMLAFSLSTIAYFEAIAGDAVEYLYAIVWMYMVFYAPKWMEKWIYKSGLSNVARGGLSGAVSISMLRRGFMR